MSLGIAFTCLGYREDIKSEYREESRKWLQKAKDGQPQAAEILDTNDGKVCKYRIGDAQREHLDEDRQSNHAILKSAVAH